MLLFLEAKRAEDFCPQFYGEISFVFIKKAYKNPKALFFI